MSDAKTVDVDENSAPIKQHKRSRHPIEFLPRCCPRYRRPRCFLVDIVVFTFTVVFCDEEVIKVSIVLLLVSYEMLVLVVVVVVSFARCSCVNNEARGDEISVEIFRRRETIPLSQDTLSRSAATAATTAMTTTATTTAATITTITLSLSLSD